MTKTVAGPKDNDGYSLWIKMNVTKVVFAAGFKNLSYFSRDFLAEFGTSPHKFRKKTDLERLAKKKRHREKPEALNCRKFG